MVFLFHMLFQSQVKSSDRFFFSPTVTRWSQRESYKHPSNPKPFGAWVHWSSSGPLVFWAGHSPRNPVCSWPTLVQKRALITTYKFRAVPDPPQVHLGTPWAHWQFCSRQNPGVGDSIMGRHPLNAHTMLEHQCLWPRASDPQVQICYRKWQTNLWTGPNSFSKIPTPRSH